MKILIGSENSVKINAVKEAFLHYYGEIDAIGIKVKSLVGDQPIGDDTFRGAENRAIGLKRINGEKKMSAEYFVGIEGGITKLNGIWFSFGAVCIMDKDAKSFGTTPFLPLPDSVVDELLDGIELSAVIDRLANDVNCKQKGGSTSFFTKGKVDRKKFYLDGCLMALVPFLNKDLFRTSKQKIA